jgi:hypothetical protein
MVKVQGRFCVSMSPGRNNGGVLMHQSTWVVLLLLMAGEVAILAFAGFVLWLAGEFGEAPKWRGLRGLRKLGSSRRAS